jgi:RimJ/RimL family protein N-acetyltransferase
MTIIIETERLILRAWRKEDAEAYFQINQDPKVIELLRGSLTEVGSIKRIFMR